MSIHTLGRRRFLQAAGAAAAGTILARDGAGAADPPDPLVIEEPFHGAILNHRHGKRVPVGLEIEVSGKAPPGEQVTVGGRPARRDGDRFIGRIVLREKETDIVASLGSDERHTARVRVVWDRHSFPRYRFSIDDNSFFLRDIAQKKYKSLFDCFYLDMLRKLHRRYRARFVLNIYYTTGDDFNLTQFPDRYRAEWEDNSDWMKLAFHAYANLPDRPYQDAPPEKLLADFDQVSEQIHRFAGEKTYSLPTVIHWGMVRPEALKPLAKRGVRALSGYFRRWGDSWDVNYRLDDVRSEYLSRHDALKDFDSGIVFSRVDIVCNSTPVEQTVPTLAPLAKDPNTAEIMDLFTHEQYFWPFYSNHIPDHAQRLDVAIRWVTEHGYKPVFFHEGLLGGPE
jgi:hypothetical protein